MCDTLDFLNLHYFKRDSYYLCNMSSHHRAVEDKKTDAVAHLAVARSQKTRNGISGDYTKDEGAVAEATAFYKFFLRVKETKDVKEIKKDFSYNRLY